MQVFRRSQSVDLLGEAFEASYALSLAASRRFTKLEGLIERGLGAIADEMATKDQLSALHTQVNSIEQQLRGMKHVKLEDRVAAIEQKVFGEIRA